MYTEQGSIVSSFSVRIHQITNYQRSVIQGNKILYAEENFKHTKVDIFLTHLSMIHANVAICYVDGFGFGPIVTKAFMN